MGTHTMLFDPAPKMDKIDLRNREVELEKFKNVLQFSSLIVIQGLRRTGKTSFMNVALQESDQLYVVMDMRGLSYNPSYADLVKKVEYAFNRLDEKWFTRIISTLKQVNGVNLLGNSISLNWSKEGTDLAVLFDKIDTWALKNNTKFIIAFDEIQLIRGDKNILNLFAHIIDYNRNTCLVVTGSEIGLLYDFLSVDDPSSPLFGRHYAEITMKNFTEPESKQFLIEGFNQIGLEPTTQVIEYAVSKLNGTVGWLTLFGAKCREENKVTPELIDEMVNSGGNLARSEAEKLVSHSSRYAIILNYLSSVNKASWTQIKSVIETNEGRSITNSSVSKLLNNLVKTGMVLNDEQYSLSDPLLKHGLQKKPLPQ